MADFQPGPALTADAIVERTSDDGKRMILLVERRWPPLGWALPGGFVEAGESCEQACLRELLEETSLVGRIAYQQRVYSDPARDPRRATATVVFVVHSDGVPTAGDDAAALRFWPLDALPPLCFDHGEVVGDYLSGRFVPAHAR